MLKTLLGCCLNISEQSYELDKYFINFKFKNNYTIVME